MILEIFGYHANTERRLDEKSFNKCGNLSMELQDFQYNNVTTKKLFCYSSRNSYFKFQNVIKYHDRRHGDKNKSLTKNYLV